MDDDAIVGQSACFPSKTQTLLLRAALLEGERARDAFRRWRGLVDPMALDPGSFRLLPLLAKSLVELGEGDPHLDRWKGTCRRAFAFNSTLFHDMAPVVRALSDAAIPALVVDGGAIVATVFEGESGLRPMGDLALLVRPQDAGRAVAALGGLGWRCAAPFSERLVATVRGAPLDGPGDRRLDLHWSFLRENCYPGADDAIWEAARAARLGALEVRAPGAADQLLRACVDGLQPTPGQRSPWAADAFSLAASGGVDWRRLETEAARRRVALPVRAALRWIREHVDAPVPDEALAGLEALPVTAAERRELGAKLDPGRPTAGLRILWAHHARAAAGQGRGRAATLARFFPYLTQVWGLAHMGQLPGAVLRRGLERIRERPAPFRHVDDLQSHIETSTEARMAE